ncbi:hypothetical protein VNO77_34345 [Canavalia gladiata]|uniref:Uncharacterized protein n=1 Tax=Canavalia gladiata TaxID=3824 RepID=A0AAN9PYG3_CANGL
MRRMSGKDFRAIDGSREDEDGNFHSGGGENISSEVKMGLCVGISIDRELKMFLHAWIFSFSNNTHNLREKEAFNQF